MRVKESSSCVCCPGENPGGSPSSAGREEGAHSPTGEELQTSSQNTSSQNVKSSLSLTV